MACFRLTRFANAIKLLIVTFTFAAASAVQSSPAQSPDAFGDKRLKAVFDAWRLRQDRAETFEIAFRDRMAVHSSFLKPGHNPLLVEWNDDEFASVVETTRMMASGQQLRIETTKSANQVSEHLVVVYNGENCTSLRSPDERIPRHAAFISTLKDSITIGLWGYKPIFLYFRPLDVELTGVNFKAAVIEPEPAAIANQECLVLRMPHLEDTLRYFVANDGEFFPILRIQRIDAKGFMRQFDIKYRRDNDFGFVPVTWCTVKTNGTNSVIHGFTAFECNIGLEIDNERFTADLPVGTQVCDMTNRDNIRDYIIPSAP